MTRTAATITAAALAALALTGCTTPTEIRTTYLADMDKHGAATGGAMRARGEAVTTERCDQARVALQDGIAPGRSPGDSKDAHAALIAEGGRVFIAACLNAGRTSPAPTPSN